MSRFTIIPMYLTIAMFPHNGKQIQKKKKKRCMDHFSYLRVLFYVHYFISYFAIFNLL